MLSFNEPGKKFLMKPDIVVKRKSDKAVFVLDTKWKLLDAGKANYGISQADMYQMYAYQKNTAQNIVHCCILRRKRCRRTRFLSIKPMTVRQSLFSSLIYLTWQTALRKL